MRTILVRTCFHAFALAACLLALATVILRALLTELADEVRASRREGASSPRQLPQINNRIPGGGIPMSSKKEFVSTSMMRAVNNVLEDRVSRDADRTAMVLATLQEARATALKVAL
jgi:hypothetical protein